MLRKTGAALLLLMACQAQAAYQCNVKPQDDVFINQQTVKVVGASGELVIAKNGDVTRNGKALALSDAARNQAVTYQQSLRGDLPYINDGVRSRLKTAQGALDGIIVKQLGTESNVRKRLVTLSSDLTKEMEKVLEPRAEGIAFHHQAVAQVETNGRTILQNTLGGVLQDSINELGIQQVAKAGKSSNPLQAVLGSLGGLQQQIQDEWKKQEKDFDQFGKEACGRVVKLEQQRVDLLRVLPQ
ncbi:DUF2884 family protein [Pragia fontium]|uniref:DUF2884 domain-containing protein n=2 Tax=Pragia fontium TaxID=82985 RepID=A0AAJ4W865_9GAMM|nr:DUF2884 family protein [Pragia fontium]AKJ41178.1 hypothetical protein QQ39_03020 [Pragia fontium]SFC11070.1 Protein of unknown function [Pragia fontium DSM 5563 = ATCC 49100]SUB81388.1 Protein of uncharacterised function (DUF2884) [Pragia fontium]VEJ53615.1 Protein of uncharacterised function (DUF2884) [Pragia fontium]GKX63379.1 hypothetical protein SOASR032_19480 [Pragia fontium]